MTILRRWNGTAWEDITGSTAPTNVVDTTSSQSIAGNKTFSGQVVVQGTDVKQRLDALPAPQDNIIFADRINPAVMRGEAADGALGITTYDGSGQATHPSVLYFRNGWNGWNYWMAFTPYNAGNDDYENPSLLVSNDGIGWQVPAGVTNPLDTVTGTPYNSDTELVMDPDGLTMHLIWRYYQNPGLEQMYKRSSTDGVTWSAKTLVYSVADTVRRLMSPTLIYENGTWTMWAIDILPSPNVMVKLTCPTLTGTWSAPITCTVANVSTGREVHHLQIRKIGQQFVGLMNDCDTDSNGLNGDVMVMTSDDGVAWTLGPPCIPRSNGALHTALYRSSLVPAIRNGVLGFDVWYPGWTTGPTSWHLYFTHVSTRIEESVIVGQVLSSPPAGGSDHKDITFPPGAFTKPPFVVASTTNTRATVGAALITKDGCRILVDNWTAGAISSIAVNYRAVGY